MKPSEKLQRLLDAGMESGLGYTERLLVGKFLEREGSPDARWNWHKEVTWIRDEEMMPPENVASFVRALAHDEGAAPESARSGATAATPARAGTVSTYTSHRTFGPSGDVGPSRLDSIPIRQPSGGVGIFPSGPAAMESAGEDYLREALASGRVEQVAENRWVFDPVKRRERELERIANRVISEGKVKFFQTRA